MEYVWVLLLLLLLLLPLLLINQTNSWIRIYMGSSSSSSASSSSASVFTVPEYYYDVFLSFRGEDVRYNIISHLKTRLEENDIKTFIDDEGLQRGDKISRALEEAIERSKLAIVVFSKDYASSSWCLQELVHILKCRKTNDQIVMPLFYHVVPSDVRHQKGSFQAAFDKHKGSFEIGKVKGWRDALFEAADLSGWDSQVIRSEAELLKKMVEDISGKLNNNPLNNEQKELVSKLKNARLLLDNAEGRQLREKGVKEWLNDLNHVKFQAEDLVEEIENEKFGWKCAWTVKGEIRLILKELDNLQGQANILSLKHVNCALRDEGHSRAITTPLRDRVFGRNGDRDRILELLSSDGAFGGDRIGMIPIVGMGGLGKTTLARLVYDDKLVKDLGFELRAWVHVSTEFDVFRIIKSILRQINQPSEVEEPEELQRKMKNALRRKKFLFVLDDLWDENYDKWDLLMNNFSTGVFSSRIVVTTRSAEVGSMVKTGPIHEIGQLSDDDCWSIFIHHALICVGDSNSNRQLERIGRQIVKKCKGLPLAVKAIGRLLCSERRTREWESVLNSQVWEWGENNQGHGVLPALWVSYRFLPSSVKQCFSYCSLFPQDYEFGKKQMVLLWMAVGFLPSGETETRSMEEVGAQYFDILVSRSLFQRSSRDESKFVMHDLIHDLAVFVSGKFCVSVAEEDVELIRTTVRTRHLSHQYNMELDSKLLSGVSEAKHLRSFLLQKRSYEFRSCDDEFVKKLTTNHRCLRALSMSMLIRDPISASFCNLKHLRYLNLSHCRFEEVPSSVCTLFNLQTLILSGCSGLTQLPTDITKLINLRHLDISGLWGIKHMPPHMGNLKELRTLTHFIVGDPNVSACSDINEMQKLQHLSGTLTISGLENAAKFEDVGKDILRNKANLKGLVLTWTYTSISSRREDKDILDALQPHTNLERLVIERYQALGFPTWVGEMSYNKLVSVKLLLCDFCESLPPFWHLPSLLKLMIKGFAKLEKMGLEIYGNDSSTSRFECLETLEIGMKSLKEWVFVDKALPRLKKLNLVGCNDLLVSSINCKTVEEFEIYKHSGLECFPLDQFPMLRKLTLDWCLNLKAVTNDGNSESLTEMQLKNCPELESLGLPKSLTHLEIWGCSKLVVPESRLGLQNLPALVSLSIIYGKCESAATSSSSELFAQVFLPNSLASLQLHYLRGFKSINGRAFQQAKSLKTLEIRGCDELESLPEEELPSSLSTLYIFSCRLLERKYHNSKGDESYQHISRIPNFYIGDPIALVMNDEVFGGPTSWRMNKRRRMNEEE